DQDRPHGQRAGCPAGTCLRRLRGEGSRVSDKHFINARQSGHCPTKEYQMADITKLVDQLSELTVLEAADLAKALEEKWGVSAAAAVAVAGPAAAGPAAPAAEEKTEFDVILTGDGGKKINVIKEVRAITGLG